MKRTVMIMAALVSASVVLVSCGSYTAPQTNTGNKPSGLKFRVFVGNPLEPSSLGPTPLLNIVDASTDLLSLFAVPLSGASTTPQFMVESADRHFTLIYSLSDHTLGMVDNQTERAAVIGSNNFPTLTLTGQTESMFFSQSGAQIFAAVPTTPVIGQQPGSVEIYSTSTGTKIASVSVPAAHYIVQNHSGSQVLTLSDATNFLTVITPANIGTTNPAATPLCGPTTATNPCPFDHPVWAVFSADDSTAYVLSCGQECGGTQASLVALNMNAAPPAVIAGSQINLTAGTTGLLAGTFLYVAGAAPGTACTGSSTPTSASSCGTLSVIDLTARTVKSTSVITDGYHNRMEMGPNNQLFIGSHNCTIVNSGSEVRGCLSIANAQNPQSTQALPVVVPPQIGDVTGIAPITGRNVVYVGQNAELWIYDTTTDKLIPSSQQIDIIGQVTDVKLVDQ